MHVVIIGAGKLGFTIAELLSRENFDIVVVDHDEDQLTAIKENLDVLTICANGSSPVTMDDPDIYGADILIAVTAMDEVNLVCCILAKKHGISHTVARIRDIEFFSEAGEYLKKHFDIDLILNPEQITADEIHQILITPAALNVEDFAHGKIRLFETRINRRSKIANIPLKNLKLPPGVLAGMIFRDHQMIIPHGNDQFQTGDNAYFVGIPDAIGKFSEQNFAHHDSTKLERVMIIGAGRIGRSLAVKLSRENVYVKIFEKDPERCQQVAEDLEGKSIAICGDGTNIDLLAEEGIAFADAVVCVTEDDRLNLMMAILSKHLGAKKTVVRVYRTEYVEMIEKVGVDVAVSARMLSASEVLAFARRGGVVSVSILEGAQAEAIEVIVQTGAKVAGKKLMDAKLPKECLVCAYVRNDIAMIPIGATVLQPGDRTILIVLKNHVPAVMEYFR